MKKLVVLLVLVLGIFVVGFGDKNDVTLYSGGKGKVDFANLPSTVPYQLQLSLPTTLKSVLIEVSKGKAKAKQYVPDIENGKIIIDYLFKDGPGEYEWVIYGSDSKSSTQYAGIASFKIKVTDSIPADFPGLNDVEMTYFGEGKGKIKFEPINKSTDFSVRLAGTTSLGLVTMEFKKEKGRAKSFTVPIKNGAFAFDYLLKDGPGTYTITVYGDKNPNATSFSGIQSFSVTSKNPVPSDLPGMELNDAVMDFVNANIGKTVGRGECWDLAQAALDLNGADWTRPVTFGRLLDPKVDEVKPGDIIQFLSVKLEQKIDGGTRTESYGSPDHTSVVYEVYGKLNYKLAHENVGGKRYVVFSDIDFNNLKSGKFWIWRPISAVLP